MRTTKDLLQDLANLEPSDCYFIVCIDTVFEDTGKVCPECNGSQYFTRGNYTYTCKACNGSGKVIERKTKYVVRTKYVEDRTYPNIEMYDGTIQLFDYYDIQGFFNNKKEAQKLADKMSKIVLEFKVKAGENGKIFGGISSKEIAEKLEKEHQIKVDKKKIELKDAIKTLGITNVEIKLFEGVTGKVKVKAVEA